MTAVTSISLKDIRIVFSPPVLSPSLFPDPAVLTNMASSLKIHFTEVIYMKKKGILHPELAFHLAELGHLDRICVADAGLPIPDGVPRIDLAYSPGKPPFFSVLEALREELVVETILTATETDDSLSGRIMEMFPGCPSTSIPHDKFKELLSEVRLVVRTGEFTPYCNVVLTCGVPF